MNPIKLTLPLLAFHALLLSADPDTTASDDNDWDVTGAHGPATQIKFETTEGTWMSLDVSPDGKTIVFDLLGDIYSLPIGGGTAKRLTSGPAWDVQPAFSPDGKTIAITSDRGGADNIWTIDANGENPQQISEEKDRILNNPVFTPDGLYIIGRKHYRNTRSLGAGEMWIYHVSGGGGAQISERRDWQHEAGDPDISPDGRYLYYAQDVTPGEYFEYNKNPYGTLYAIERIDLTTGEQTRLVSGLGGSMTPQISPDGKSLAFIRRVQLKTALFIKDLATGNERMLFDGMSRDAQETWAHFGTNPGYAWTPDGMSIITSAMGKLWKISTTSGKATAIPFTAAVEQTITDALQFEVPMGGSTYTVKGLRERRVSPLGNKVAFQALGKVYVSDTNGKKRKRLTKKSDRFEAAPAWSPDGKRIAIVTWKDGVGGGIEVLSATNGKGKRLKLPVGHYNSPAWSPNGTQLVYRRSGGNSLRGYDGSADPGIYVISASGGTPKFVTKSGSNPHFSPNGKRIVLQSMEDEENALISVDLNGEDRRVLATSKSGANISLSPNGKWFGFQENYNLFVAPAPATGKATELSSSMKQLPVSKASRDGAFDGHWSGNSIYWTTGSDLYQRTLSDLFEFVSGAPDSLPGPDTIGVSLGWMAKSDQPKGTIALTGATIITLDESGTIDNGVVVVKNGRITAVGPKASTSVPKGATVIDVSGKFIMPGIVDVHAHMGSPGDGIDPQQNWNYLANLAFGVTTTHDPSRGTQNVFANAELQKSGQMLAPRLYSTGTILYGAEAPGYKAVVNSLDDARSHLRRLKAFGAFSVKSYNQPRRDQRQQILVAARELGMMVYPEGGSTLQWNVNMVVDGHTGVEHSIPVSPLYNDVLTLYGRSNVGYTPTLVVSYGGLWGENYWYQHQNVFEHERLLTFIPRNQLDRVGRRRMHVEDDDYNHIRNAQAAKALSDAGVKVNLGAHGQLDGLGAHWEMWSLVQGGMTNEEALRASTINGAEYIGMGADIGTITVGKLGDLLVLDANPLTDIQNSEQVDKVMLGGRLYTGANLDQVWPKAVKRPSLYWE